jgi:hypothetical protein
MISILSLLVGFFVGCNDAKEIFVVDNQSFLLGFEIRDGNVYAKCRIVINNSSDKAQKIQLVGDFSKEVEQGLLRTAEIVASAEDYETDFFEVLPGENKLIVYFIGENGTADTKPDRLLPPMEIIVLKN